MSSKTIYLIRHGETDYNSRGLVQGSGIDAPLNEKGRKQATAFYESYKGTCFDKVYTSELIRTHQTVKGFLDNGLSHTSLEGLNEISWGEMEGITPNVGNDPYYLEITGQWHSGQTEIPVKGGESPENVAERQREAFKHIINRKDEKLILIAMHGRAICILLAWLSGLPIAQMGSFKHSNVCLYKIEYSYITQEFVILEQNNVKHLEGLV